MSADERSGNRMFAAKQTDEFSARNQFFRLLVKSGHHFFRSLERREYFERMDSDFINFRVGFLFIELHISRSLDNRHRSGTRSGPIWNSSFIWDRENDDSGSTKIWVFFFLNAAEIHRQICWFTHLILDFGLWVLDLSREMASTQFETFSLAIRPSQIAN